MVVIFHGKKRPLNDGPVVFIFYFLFLSFIISHSSCRFHGQKSQFNWSRSSDAEIFLFLRPNSKAPMSYQKGKSSKKEKLKLKSCKKKKKKMSHQKLKTNVLSSTIKDGFSIRELVIHLSFL